MPLLDRLDRPLRSLRLSVTDRCNLRCGYCMPEEEYTWLPKARILRFEEISALVDVFLSLGVERVRLTGGEPLLRRDLPVLVRMLAAKPGLRDLALTTNALQLGEQARELREAGLARVTISLDSLRRERFRELTRRDALPAVLAGIEAARAAGFGPIKLNTVVMRGANDDEILDLLEFARAGGHELRYIEYMDVGGATRWSADEVVPRAEILRRIAERHGEPEPLLRAGPRPAAGPAGSAPAERFRLADGTRFGVIASTTQPFCRACDRARLTADGHWFLCLYARVGIDLGAMLRAGRSSAEIAERIRAAWSARDDRGAEQRLALEDRGRLAQAGDLRDDPHLEMHTRGG